jgi:hypothetical protein
MKYGGIKRGLVSAIVLGLAQLAKYTCLVLYPLFFFFVLLISIYPLFKCLVKKEMKEAAKRAGRFCVYTLLFIGIGLLIINAGFSFYKTGTSLSKYNFYSTFSENLKKIPLEHLPEPLREQRSFIPSFFLKLQQGPLKDIPLPLPVPYIEGLEHIDYTDLNGLIWNIYLLGEVKKAGQAQGFQGYFFWVLLFKTPIALLILFLCSCVYCFFRFNLRKFLSDEGHLLLPIVFFLIYYLSTSMQFGIRSILFVLPLACVFASSLFENWTRYHLRIKLALATLAAYFFISVLSYYPHYVSYFNEFVWDRKKAYKILADSNLNLGGVNWYAFEYLDKHPEVVLGPLNPIPGRLMVEVNDLVGVFKPEKYRWLRENFEPIGHVAYVFLLYDVKVADFNALHLNNL